MSSSNIVRDHFDRAADRFDAVYEEGKPFYQRVIDRMFRRVVVERFRLICNLAPLPSDWKVLDAGCGSGRYALALAAEGASRVVGVDFAEEMIRIARDEVERAGLSDTCEFHVAEFKDFSSEERFEAVVATGYFDYLAEPVVDLELMVRMCSGRIYASFPKRWEWRVPIRKLRFLLSRSFVRFYTKREVLGVFASAGVPPERLSLIDLGRDWIAVARP
ncbi:MAG: methyltransferase domain-containing protein [Candidatus Eisenbacteria bacterium]|nr:methyltransferase domain-containing protein [Candidatus Eisenbacteria bacterium]